MNRRGLWITAGALVLLAMLVLSVALGAVWISPGTVLRVVAGFGDGGEAQSWQRLVIVDVRLPRALIAAVGGAALAVSGAAMQGLFRNPMADPGILGVSAGAALGAVAALYGLTFLPGAFGVPMGAFAGALLAAFVVYALALRAGRASTETLLLAGIAVSGVASALTSLVLSLALAEWELGREMVLWLMGGLDRASWGDLAFLAIPVLVGTIGLATDSRALDLMLTGEDSAASLGVDVSALTKRVLVYASLATAAAVSVMGVVAFVGLLVPHIVRRILGPGHLRLFPVSALLGAVVVTGADLVTRLLPHASLRLGVVTSLVGGPFFLYLLLRRGQRAGRAP
jgi:iron complex transport system permease protein